MAAVRFGSFRDKCAAFANYDGQWSGEPAALSIHPCAPSPVWQTKAIVQQRLAPRRTKCAWTAMNERHSVTDTIFYISPWVLGSVCVGLGIGFFLGRSNRALRGDAGSYPEKDATMRILMEVLQEMEHVTGGVHERNTEIRQTARDVDDMVVTPEMEEIKTAVLGHVSKLLESNQELEDNLLYTQYRVHEQAQEIDSARREARTDSLTGVANRKAFDEKLHVSVGAYQRMETPFVLVLIDVDHFKRVNDSHGHQAGDRILETLGAAMREVVREGDFVARLGGDEFGIILPHTDMEVGYSVAQRIHGKVAEETSHLSHSGNQLSVGLSVGVAAVRPSDTSESIYARADEALYKSKNRGRNQVQREELEEILA